MSLQVAIPAYVQVILKVLRRAGYQACPVGGCVRDSLLGKVPHDWDIATSALPMETEQTLAGFSCFETGMRHGTITAISDGHPVEITTFRIDGSYSDHRRPDSVTFTRNLAEDLRRRDFTINAMAWDNGLVDLFGGRADLEAGIVRCVGDPAMRFQEDGLRVLRALRFASVLDFTLAPETSLAVHRLRGLLEDIAAERISEELKKLLCGPGVGRILRQYADVLFTILPMLSAQAGCPQHNPYHNCDVWEHTVRAVEAAPAQPLLRLILLLHDAGKPACRSTGPDGIDHFYRHDRESARLAEQAAHRLRLSSRETRTVSQAVARHMLPMPPERRLLRRRLNQFGLDFCLLLLAVQRADTLAQPPAVHSRLRLLDQSEAILRALVAEDACFSRAQLAVKGDDLVKLGLSGPAIGRALDYLLNAVIEEQCPNEKVALLDYWRQHGEK